jgi:acyl dehydratase
MTTLTFEDFKPGRFGTFGPRHVTREEILEFAGEFDPQPMHLDEEAAKKTMLGGLSASGWHTCALMMRLLYDGFIVNAASMGAPGIDDLKWLKPVRPGDAIHLEGEVVELVPSRSKPHGVARVKWTAYNQNGEAVYTFNPIAIVPSRPK